MKKITLYTTPTCPYCHKAKDYLQSKGYPFSEIDVSKNTAGQAFLRSKGIMGVPVITVGDTIIQGFDPTGIEKALDFVIGTCSECKKKLRLPKGKGKIRVHCPACDHTFEKIT